MSDDHNTNTPSHHVDQQLAESSVPLLKQRSSDEWYNLGLFLYYKGRVQAAFIAIVVNALQYNPNHEGSRAIAPLKMVPKAIMDFTDAIELDVSHLKAHLFRAKCYFAIGQYEKASEAHYEIYAMTGIPEYYRLSEEAYNEECNLDFALFTLSLTRDCSVLDVKAAFRREARLHHPDLHAGASNEIQEREEETFKEVQRARQILLDFLKRKNRFNNNHVWFSNTDYFEL
ncbi:dnaJ homolog subfamily C member 7-like isoform X2 [Dendronephthya gigantea]|nr:dnaJ homolog subfamily C member 7-like isoform X2 [Dendronephthya gigantea]XP_028417419.1 dnaJ homolog subfamily C member 7-like isoform X2 [Dendronephthya gigantea]XP_028417420.1 dnaJ homolog subfamily C member 7-like isoform X2 [Dendronephthya gigantea]XP_028417421.1 dnaJ homolog subfamily C member 7-like isoform X2 [Dendronephthya gigantea]XP_028417422.1 dnaJ homolog subfamily C member 7-like isoform X2 [Dendronephthya gigantea]